MAYEIPGVVISLPSGSTTLTQYKIVRVNSAGAVVHTTGPASSTARVFALGVLQSVPSASTSSTGQVATVMISGVTKVRASSRAIATGANIRYTSGAAATSGGRAMSSSASTKHNIVGIALSSAAASTGPRYISMRLF